MFGNIEAPLSGTTRRGRAAAGGGGSGIRTREGVAPLHAFQACPLGRSGKPPGRLYGTGGALRARGRDGLRERDRAAAPGRAAALRAHTVRRRRDSNTRGAIKPLTAFEAVPFVRSGTPPSP